MNATTVWSGPDFQRCTGKRIQFTDTGVALRRGVTLADELGKCNDRDREIIRGRRIARKVFQVDRIGSAGAILCPYLECDRTGGRIKVTVNGQDIEHEWAEERPYWTDRWTPLEIPPGWLVAGDNAVCFEAVEDSEWSLLIESSRQPDRSAISEDGGVTWRSEDIGWNDGCDGEYMVRLWLDQYPERVAIESEVIDLCRDPDADLAVQGQPRLSYEYEADTPDGTQACLRVRTGSTPQYDPDHWCPWGDSVDAPQRFAHWQVELVSENPDRSPTLKRVSFQTEAEGNPHTRVVARSQAPLLKSSYRFAQSTSQEPRAERLREKWQLDEVVRGAGSEWEAYLRLRQWVREQWEDGWDMGEIDFCPPWDAMLILELTSRKLSLGMCTHYATVMSQCCAALGLNARTQIMRSHCINEVWSTEHQKWVAMDVGGDNNDETKFVYHFERNGEPLSAVECHTAWVTDDYADVKISPEPPAATEGRYAVEKRLQLFERFMISLRNDELRSLEPGELEHGKGSYHYDGYLFWEDEKTEPLPWFSLHTQRHSDLYWSVNETYAHLKESEEGRLSVVLESPTPDLTGYERSFDGKSWEASDELFEWNPSREGTTLSVRSANRSGRHGVTSTVEVSADG